MERLILTNTTDVERFFRQQKTAWQEWGTGDSTVLNWVPHSARLKRGADGLYWGQRGEVR